MTFPSLSGPCSDCRTLAPILHSLTALGDFRQGWPKLAPMCDAHRMWPTARQRDADSRWISSRLKGQLSSSSKTQKLFSNGTCWTIKRAASYTFSLQKSSLLPTRSLTHVLVLSLLCFLTAKQRTNNLGRVIPVSRLACVTPFPDQALSVQTTKTVRLLITRRKAVSVTSVSSRHQQHFVLLFGQCFNALTA